MKLSILDIDAYSSQLEEIKNTRVFARPGVLDPDGLHSPITYESDIDKRSKVCYYDLGRRYVHPFLLYVARRRSKQLYEGILGRTPLSISGKTLVGDFEKGLRGTELVREVYERRKELELSSTLKRVLESAPTVEVLLPTKVLIIPPVFRPVAIIGELEEQHVHPLDLLYSQLSSMKEATEEVLHSLVDKIVVSTVDALKGKSGILRSTLLTRRLDFTARLVITVDPTLPIDNARLPYPVLALLFAPFLVRALLVPPVELKRALQEVGITLKTTAQAISLVEAFYRRKLPPKVSSALTYFVDFVVKDKVIIAKRDPVLHWGGVFAFRPIGFTSPIGTEVYTMAISPYITTPIGGDFDGDTMAVFVPHTIEAQREAQQLLPSRNKFNVNVSKCHFTPKLDYLLALYVLTASELPGNLHVSTHRSSTTMKYPSSSTPEFNFKDVSFQTPVYVNLVNTGKVVRSTLGRYLFNTCHNTYEYFNEHITKKNVQSIFDKLASILSDNQFSAFLQNLNRLVEEVLKHYPLSFVLERCVPPEELLSRLKGTKDNQQFAKVVKDATSEFVKHLKSVDPSLTIYLESGARSNEDTLRQLFIARGFVESVHGSVLPTPVRNSYFSGLSVDDIYNSAPGWRKGVIEKSIGVSDSGYLTRKLIYLLESVVLGGRDCKTTTGLTLDTSRVDQRSLFGRRLMDKTVITPETNLPSKITIRSPLYCIDPRGICEVCYGESVTRVLAIGLLAAQTLGERSTQLTFKTWHAGGVRGVLDEFELPPPFKVVKGIVSAMESFSLVIDIDNENTKVTTTGIILYPQTLNLITKKGTSKKVDLPTTLQLSTTTSKVVESATRIIYTFKKGEAIGSLLSYTGGVTTVVERVHRLLDAPLESPMELLLTLYDMYRTVAILPLVHFELVTTVLTRSARNPDLMWRLDQTSMPLVVPFKQSMLRGSPLTAFLFADPGVGLLQMIDKDVDIHKHGVLGRSVL